MKNKFAVFYFFLLILLCQSHTSFAQAGYDQDTADSTLESPVAFDSDDAYSDTIIKRTLINYEKDSLQKWKQNREFAYMKYLDSLLKERSDLRSDTVSVQFGTGKINHKKPTDYSAINRFLNSLPLKIFFWAMALFFIGFIIYRMFFKNGLFDGLKNRKSTVEDEEDALKGLGEFSEYDALISEAEAGNNFNLSARYLYLQTLKILSDKGDISFSPDKTNAEYVREMERHAYRKQFATLTRNYEYVWYGTFLIDQFQYQKLKNEFIEFNKKV